MERWRAEAVVGCYRQRIVMMKKTYVKPTLVKRGKLTERTAQIVASGVVLGE